MFCNDLDEETRDWLLGNLGSEAPGPMTEAIDPVQVELATPSVYIVCQNDEAIPPEIQREQARNAGAAEVVSFDSGHSAFASRPRELAELLIGLG
jgi:pimeloyl-ACP methyl ester carboxylesterase